MVDCRILEVENFLRKSNSDILIVTLLRGGYQLGTEHEKTDYIECQSIEEVCYHMTEQKERMIFLFSNSQRDIVNLLKKTEIDYILYFKPEFRLRLINNLRLEKTKALCFTILFNGADSRYILPKKVPINEALKMHPKGIFIGRLRNVLLNWACKLGFRNLFPSISIYNMSEHDDSSLVDEIIKKTEEIITQTVLFTGTPGITRRLTLQLKTNNNNYLYAKISTNSLGATRIEFEARVLDKLKLFNFKSFLHPKKHFFGKIRGKSVLIQSSYPDSNFKRVDTLTIAHYKFLRELYFKTSKQTILDEHPIFKYVINNLNSSHTIKNDSIVNFLKKKSSTKIKSVAQHGDFTPWNVKSNREQLFIYDWESFEEQSLPLFDYFHYIIQEGVLIKHLSATQILDRIITSTNFTEIPDLEKLDLDLLLLLFVLYSHIKYSKLVEIQDPGFKQVSWQNKTRTELIELILDKIKIS